MANEKIHEYIDEVVVNDVKGKEIWIDTDTGNNANGWLSKKLNIEILAEILRTNFKVYGQFSSDEKQEILRQNVPQQITLNQTFSSQDIDLISDAIVVQETGIYRIQYILTTANNSGTHAHLDSWIVLDGDDVNLSRKRVDVHSNQSGSPLVNETIFQIDAGSELTFWMLATNTNVLLQSEAGTTTIPLLPSIVVTMEKI
jgi:hypothetical protein